MERRTLVSYEGTQAVYGAGGTGRARGRDACDFRPWGTGGSAMHLSHEPGADEPGP
jgi:hypothetical protein